jgi:plastocyanin
MRFLITLLAILFFALPVSALDVKMGANGSLVFEPSELFITSGETVHFVNEALPPHNVIVEDHSDISHNDLAFAPGESFDITFDEPGDFNFWCDPHKGAGMTGTVHVS